MTSIGTVTSPARSKVRVTGNVRPASSGAFRPNIIRCSPPGASVADPPAGTSMASTGRMRMISPSSRCVCSSTRAATAGAAAATRRSASAPPFAIVR